MKIKIWWWGYSIEPYNDNGSIDKRRKVIQNDEVCTLVKGWRKQGIMLAMEKLMKLFNIAQSQKRSKNLKFKQEKEKLIVDMKRCLLLLN